ncbi:hypothetical protein MPSEU_000014800 [Mayamaea pseudoterrestris]|nr:hypothetical protein MPSEU_000014800 [Mayamaea pseudoterrestris]
MSEPTKRDPYYSSGLDIKSITLNIASFLVFIFPIGCYFYAAHFKLMLFVVALWLLAAYLAPPVGFLRPHPYSDIPANRTKKA